ncbi:hypothetical protein J4Q44_G00309150 [Coregonus suidteri]|uniref:Uncharacterized protein n=1 Tax=Coregonus suidteri TaxID=861788 RepID=A0AAN8QC05_9TELE
MHRIVTYSLDCHCITLRFCQSIIILTNNYSDSSYIVPNILTLLQQMWDKRTHARTHAHTHTRTYSNTLNLFPPQSTISSDAERLLHPRAQFKKEPDLRMHIQLQLFEKACKIEQKLATI